MNREKMTVIRVLVVLAHQLVLIAKTKGYLDIANEEDSEEPYFFAAGCQHINTKYFKGTPEEYQYLFMNLLEKTNSLPNNTVEESDSISSGYTTSDTTYYPPSQLGSQPSSTSTNSFIFPAPPPNIIPYSYLSHNTTHVNMTQPHYRSYIPSGKKQSSFGSNTLPNNTTHSTPPPSSLPTSIPSTPPTSIISNTTANYPPPPSHSGSNSIYSKGSFSSSNTNSNTTTTGSNGLSARLYQEEIAIIFKSIVKSKPILPDLVINRLNQSKIYPLVFNSVTTPEEYIFIDPYTTEYDVTAASIGLNKMFTEIKQQIDFDYLDRFNYC